MDKNYTKLSSSSYVMLHNWVRDTLGRAVFCSNDQTHIGRKYHWANISGEYKRDLNDFRPLCVSCHAKYDFSESKREFLRKINIGNINHAKKVKQYNVDGTLIKTYSSSREASKITGVSYKAISNMLVGKSKTAGGYIWEV